MVKEVNETGRSADQVKDAAMRAIEKAAKESFEAKMKNLFLKRQEHERAIAQINEDIARESAAFEKGI